MLDWFRRWPPATWLLVYVASGLIILGRGDVGLLVAGIVLTVIAFGIAVYVALHPEPGRPRPSLVYWAIGGVGLFYVLTAIAAAFADPSYGVATLLAGLIPATAVALTMATGRVKTAGSEDRLHDTSADKSEDPFPGIGMDDQTPLGDTPEHSDAEGDPYVERERRVERARRPHRSRR